MKKFVKILTTICLVLLLAMPLMLVGCNKKVTIKISVASGKGSVYRFNSGISSESTTPVSVVGSNKYGESGTFEFYVKPDYSNGYIIKEVVIDGQSDGTEYPTTGKSYRFSDGKSHNVKVYFTLRQLTITLQCVDGVYGTVTAEYGQDVNFSEARFGGPNSGANWYIIDLNGFPVYLKNGQNDLEAEVKTGVTPNVYKALKNDLVVHTTLTRDVLHNFIATAEQN